MSLLRFRAVIWFRGYTTCEEMRERIEKIIRTHPHLSFRADKVEVYPNVPPGTEMFDPATITPLFEPGGACLESVADGTNETCVAAASAEALEFSPWYQVSASGVLSSGRDGWCRAMAVAYSSNCDPWDVSVGCAP